MGCLCPHQYLGVVTWVVCLCQHVVGPNGSNETSRHLYLILTIFHIFDMSRNYLIILDKKSTGEYFNPVCTRTVRGAGLNPALALLLSRGSSKKFPSFLNPCVCI